ncbi:MAG: hypothetical protein OXL96_20190 [Candidatus Poribacteria bacterium]|nr:hypothetical protein [Candidatus Poribacteria bacterium]MYH82227.1 hypothetical protein [Candidatus Poribacteria bacterium]
MNLQTTIPLRSIYKGYKGEKDFSDDLVHKLCALGVGSFKNPKRESKVSTRRADIVATGKDGILVVENQFGKADWDHWGRLDAYARSKKADVAVLVAEDFEKLMITTCHLRNEESKINWYLIQVQANSHKELSFHHVVQPLIDIQTEKKAEDGYSEFWAPIREDDGLFSGKPVLIRNDGYISRGTRGVDVCLCLTNHQCYIRLWIPGKSRLERRNKVKELFQKSNYEYKDRDTTSYATLIFPVLDKGRKDQDTWPEMRKKLVSMGTDIYTKINESDL